MALNAGISSPITTIDPGMVSQRRKLNSFHEKRLAEKSHFKNYKMGQEIDKSPKAVGDKRVGSFGNYSIQQSNKKQKVSPGEKSGF